MNRLSTLVWMLVIVGAASMLYAVKYRVQALRAEITQTARDLEAEKESLHVVAAEWAYLNRPQRLEALAAKYLASTSITVDKIAEVEAIPFPHKLEAKAQSMEGVEPASLVVGTNAGEDR